MKQLITTKLESVNQLVFEYQRTLYDTSRNTEIMRQRMHLTIGAAPMRCFAQIVEHSPRAVVEAHRNISLIAEVEERRMGDPN
jgi:hypothetical protein